MSITGSLIIFVLIWWIIFFSLLPIDVDRKHKEMVEGADKGSPENPKIIKKIIYTTIITSIIFIGIFMLVKYDYLNLRRFIS
jgi:predicted secreted protein|tara:strand:- start:44 stop:289 length:246 start_codon:yes stop_codon:yes gene_type:complete